MQNYNKKPVDTVRKCKMQSVTQFQLQIQCFKMKKRNKQHWQVYG